MENSKKNNSVICFVVLGVVAALLVILFLFNSLKTNPKMDNEIKQLELFTAAVEKEFKSIDTTDMSYKEAQSVYSEVVRQAQQQYGGGSSSTGVDAYAMNLLNTINGSVSGVVTDLTGTLTGLLEGLDINDFLGDLLGGSSNSNAITSTLTLASTTVCNSVVDSKYCLDGKDKVLSANVYVIDPNSSKWVVLVHPFMTSGSLIYNSLGSMYESQGYNVLAPDLRGFGNSDGSVAMGYLESLDIYDWIKDLNENYSVRYGVKTAPSTIIVHGISLGGATTLQLSTNPDIAAAKGMPYTKNLTQLNVKGFVDDCGYTSMSGIITGMLSIGDTSSLSSLLGTLGIDLDSFMTELKGLLNKFNISGFEGFDLNSFGDIENFTKQFSNLYEAIASAGSGSNNSNISNILNGFLGSADLDTILSKYGSYFSGNSSNSTSNSSSSSNNSSYNDWWKNNFGGMPSGSTSNDGSSNKETSNNFWGNTGWSNYTDGNASNWGNTDWKNFFKKVPQGTSSIGSSKIMLVNNGTSNSENFLDGLVGTVLMKLIGVGLTEDNYDYYSNSFASGRIFPTGSKVLIIHGTGDTTVPHSNANTVASNAGSRLFYQWNASGNPHAFVVIGTDTDKYANLVAEFTACIDGKSCSVTHLD